ncbi:hypothetical protein STCU_02201 [Strigomonas culicis]|nr:hypothetical protein STCU_02201 [Strigomonas culicis]|eukprot:EPY33472.1 hypothetical protein STCU_02201 [Strigomonas culicis]
MSWLIVACLLDKLHLQFYVDKRVDACALRGCVSSVALEPNSCMLCKHYMIQTVFTLYSLAFKWHLDYCVPTSYLVTILPHTKAQQRVLLAATIAEEVALLKKLKFNCFVTLEQITKLTDNFLTRDESHDFMKTLL